MLRNFFIVFITFFAFSTSQAADTYDSTTNILSIPQVRVDSTLYSDVQITVGTIVSIGSNIVADTFDTYNASNNQLSIPVVTVRWLYHLLQRGDHGWNHPQDWRLMHHRFHLRQSWHSRN